MDNEELSYEEPILEQQDNEYLEIVESPRRNINGISSRMYFGFDMPSIQKTSDRNQYFVFFIIGCVTSACIIAPLLVFYSPSSKQSVQNEEKCKYSPCLNNGHCIMLNGSHICICPEVFLGTSCQIQDECISSVPCHHEGTCITTDNSSYCICADGYLGKNCEYRGPSGYQFFVVFNPRQREVTLYLSSRKHGHCDIIYPSFKRTKTLTLEGEYQTFVLSNEHDFANNSENSDVHVRIFCDVLITLFHFVRDIYGSIWESYIVIPSALLSTQYVVPQYKTQQKFNALGILAIEEDTQINVSFTSARWILSNITFRQSIYHKSQLLSFTTDPYVYNYISCEECYLTGTYITSSHPVAVMFKSSIPEVVPVLPYKAFSRQFIVPKLQAEIMTMGLRIYAHTRTRLELKDDNDVVSTSVINANNYHNTNHKNTTAITADKNILLSLKIYSPHTGTIDVTVPSDTQYLPEYQFIIPEGTMKNIATFIVKLDFLQDEYGAIWKSFHGISSKGLSNEYVIPQFKPHQQFDALSVVAFEENTTVTVNFKTARWVLSNITFNESMFDHNKLTFNAAQYEYSYISLEQCHLTGTFVNGTRLALFFKTYIPEVIPVLPLDDFSKVFIVPQLSSLIKTQGLRIFSKYKTKIEFKDTNDTISTSILDVNNYLTTNHKHTTVVSSQEEIILFMKAYSPHTGTIDNVVPGVNQYLPYYEFVVPGNTNENFATFILPSGEVPGIRLNNRQFELSQSSIINVRLFDTVYSIFSISIKEGWNIAKHENYVKFGLLIQGSSNYQDKRHSSPYLYFAGRNLTVTTNRNN
ncbi:Hypothetical predicted protein [Mytilus galloprovincialis]|uniref:EGF-like domain-containing protein n=1 Tax=Mytilus galloprovincialis TaxID=29158 RepID=A0A8B6CDD1_MYTGA|nr:Hypothetical predicted protein [Mytilus galloprovincialis]